MGVGDLVSPPVGLESGDFSADDLPSEADGLSFAEGCAYWARWSVPDETRRNGLTSSDLGPSIPGAGARVAGERARTRRWVRQVVVAEAFQDGNWKVVQRCKRCGSEAHGQPHLVARGGEVASISWSHRGDYAAVVIDRRGRSVGIDIELIREPLWQAVDQITLLPWEARIVDASPLGFHQASAHMWTAKEAVLKANGTGFETDPRNVACLWLDTAWMWGVATDGQRIWAVRRLAAPTCVSVSVAVEVLQSWIHRSQSEMQTVFRRPCRRPSPPAAGSR